MLSRRDLWRYALPTYVPRPTEFEPAVAGSRSPTSAIWSYGRTEHIGEGPATVSRSAWVRAPLTFEERGQVRQWLERERDRTLQAAERAAADANELLQRRGERDPCAYLSPAVAQEDRYLAGHSHRASANLQRIRELEEALRRLQDEPERFGMCAVCEEPITMARLEVIPDARVCGSCASRSEP